TNLSDALSGQLAGVQTQTSSGIPGEEMQITVRGVSSINGSSNPLIVVDGVITENMSNVNPSDVASIQVLKDAAATSIYGAR
ncbi:UNVERIFIED_CONTAM: TonB-dependent receptor plug domain-containing protein, partial [Prevotella sp. 15_C9]